MDYSLPVMSDKINYCDTRVSPSTVHCSNVGLFNFFFRYLYIKTTSIFKWILPKNFEKNYFDMVLLLGGYVTIVETDKFGVIPQYAGLRGYNVQYQPTHAVICNPLISGIIEPMIDKQCVVIKLNPDYLGIYDLIAFHADMMALCAENAGVNEVNSKLAYIFATDDKAGAETFKKAFDEIHSGNPATVTGKTLFNDDGEPLWTTFTQNLKEVYIAPEVLATLKKWEQRYLTAIGIKVAPDKKERMITDEAQANDDETSTLIDIWLESLQAGCKKARDLFGINIRVSKRYDLKKGGSEDGTGDTINSRPLQLQ